MAELDGKAVLITGGGSGTGLATARRLFDAGATVVLAEAFVSEADFDWVVGINFKSTFFTNHPSR